MADYNPGIEKKKNTVVACETGLEIAEIALVRLGFDSKIKFAASQLLSRSVVTKFFQQKPIQLDSFKRICEGLKLNWTDLLEEDIQILSEISEDEKNSGSNQKWRLVEEIVSQTVERRNLSGTDLSDAGLRGALLSRADLRDANLRSADLSDADLSRADLRGADLSCALLRGSSLSVSILRSADLSDANLSDAIVCRADLSDANLSNAIVCRANLRGVNLSGANLSGANLSNALVVRTQFADNPGISEDMKFNLKQRGAIFGDSPGDRSDVLTPH